MEYKNLNWESLNLIRNHLYQRLIEPLSKVLEYTQEVDQSKVVKSVAPTQQQLNAMMNIIKAWSILVQWRTEGKVETVRLVKPNQLPDWLLDYLSQRAIIKLEHTQGIYVNPETFFEGIILLVNIAQAAGELSHIMLNDAALPTDGVWLRIVFMPDQQYESKQAILQYVEADRKRDIAVQFGAAGDVFELNNTRFSLQNNTRTGHQAFAALLPVKAPARVVTQPMPVVVGQKAMPALKNLVLTAKGEPENVVDKAESKPNEETPRPKLSVADDLLAHIYKVLIAEPDSIPIVIPVSPDRPLEKAEDILGAIYKLLGVNEATRLLDPAKVAENSMKQSAEQLVEIYRILDSSTVNLSELQKKAGLAITSVSTPAEKAEMILASIYAKLEAQRDEVKALIQSENTTEERLTTQIKAVIAKLSSSELGQGKKTDPLPDQTGGEPKEANEDNHAPRESDATVSSQ